MNAYLLDMELALDELVEVLVVDNGLVAVRVVVALVVDSELVELLKKNKVVFGF